MTVEAGLNKSVYPGQMVRWLLTFALASWLSGVVAYTVTPGSTADRRLLSVQDISPRRVPRALLATQATSGAERAGTQTDNEDDGDADDCNLRQNDVDL